MAERQKPWHICDDCIDPLADALFSLADRFSIPFDVAKRDRLDREFCDIMEEAGHVNDRLTDSQRGRIDELSKQMKAQTEPPSPSEVYWLYETYVDVATDWLKLHVAVEYAGDFQRTLLSARKRYFDLDFKACQIINGDQSKETTIRVRYPIRRLIHRHYGLLREAFPDHDPEPEELPDSLRTIEAEIVEEYSAVETEFRATATYLQRMSALLRTKIAKDEMPNMMKLRPSSGEAGKPEAETPADSEPDEVPVLSHRKYLILQTLLEVKATSADARETTERIVERAEGKGADPVQFKKDIASLKRAAFINTKAGSGGGCWLTPKGRKLAERLT